MKQDEFFKIIGIIIVGFFIIYIATNLFKLQSNIIEGLTNSDGTITQSTNNPSSGEGGTATSYAAAIKAQVIKIQDELLISKYRKDYETAIINLDDYIGFMMIKQALNMKSDGEIKSNIDALNNLNILKNAKESLNVTMAFLDKQ